MRKLGTINNFKYIYQLKGSKFIKHFMKYLLAMAIGAAMLGCAKKDWNCSCTVNGDNYEKAITNTTKSKANSNCTNYGKSIGQTYGSYTYVCKVN
jgi:hypothetical protein